MAVTYRYLFGLYNLIKHYQKIMHDQSSPQSQPPSHQHTSNIDLSSELLSLLLENKHLFCTTCKKSILHFKFKYTQHGKVLCIGCFAKQRPQKQERLLVDLSAESTRINAWTLREQLQFVLRIQENFRNGIYNDDDLNLCYLGQQHLQNAEQRSLINENVQKGNNACSQLGDGGNGQRKGKEEQEMSVQLRMVAEQLRQTDEDMIGNYMIAYVNQMSSLEDQALVMSFAKYQNRKKHKADRRIRQMLAKYIRTKGQINNKILISEPGENSCHQDKDEQARMRQIVERSNKMLDQYDSFMDAISPMKSQAEQAMVRAQNLVDIEQQQSRLSKRKRKLKQKGIKRSIIQSKRQKIKVKIRLKQHQQQQL